jgi:thioredoxin
MMPLLLTSLTCSGVRSDGVAADSGEVVEPIAEPVIVSVGEVIQLSRADFLTKVYNYEKNEAEWVYEGAKPCIIDFYADWCGPCRMVAPIMKELAKEYKDRLIIYKIDIERERELASAFGIRSIPLILFVPVSGKPQAAMGALPKQTMVQQIEEYLLSDAVD